MDGQRGQPATLYEVHPQGAFGLGVRLDRARIETMLIDLAGTVLDSRSQDLALPGPDEALEIIRQDAVAMLRSLKPRERKRLAGIGLAQPSHLERWLGELNLRPISAAGRRSISLRC